MNVNIILVLHKLVKIYSNLMKPRINMSSMHSSCDIIDVLLINLISCNSHKVLYLKLYFLLLEWEIAILSGRTRRWLYLEVVVGTKAKNISSEVMAGPGASLLRLKDFLWKS